jgi:transcriptional regulator with XRE-family HTH domain
VANGPVVIRKRLGRALKQLRVQRRRRLGEIATLLEISASKLSRIETGQVETKFRDVHDLLDVYEAPAADRDRILDWANRARSPAWWEPLGPSSSGVDLDLLISHETEARAKRTYCVPVAGLLQTEDYARLLLTRVFDGRAPDEIERLVRLRTGRRNVIDPGRSDAPPLELHVLMDEVALHRCADPEVLRGQVAALLERAEQPNVTLQIVPFRAGWTTATSTFSIFDPREPSVDRRVVNVEGTGSDTFVDDPQAVAGYEDVWTELLGVALSERDSVAVLTDALGR